MYANTTLKKVLRAPALIVAFGCLATSAARAADLPPVPAPMPMPPLVVQEFFSNWYVRGDFGYRWNDISGGSVGGVFPFTSATLDESLSIGGGIGFRSRWFRADLTSDYGLMPRFTGNNVFATPDITAKIESISILVNGYFDLGTWWGLTPYIGAGAGTGYLKSNGVVMVAPAGVTGQNGSSWNFAWAGMAGFSFPISQALLIDANYRYLDLGSVPGNLSIGTLDFGHVVAQEVRIGLRYNIQ